MTEIGSTKAKTHLSDLLRRVAEGENYLITARGKAVACLTPAVRKHDAAKVRNLVEELRAFRYRIAQGGPLLNAGETYEDLARAGLKW